MQMDIMLRLPINVQQYPILHKTQSVFWIKTTDCWYGCTEAFKIAYAR